MTARHGEGFKRSARIRCRREFLSLGRGGEKRRTGHFVFIAAKTATGPARLGITVSRKVGGAVTRNLLKRRIRETFRRHPFRNRFAGDLIVIAKPGVGAVSTALVRREIGFALEAFGRTRTGSR
jgi:ribonuclease P protein component